VHLEVEWYAFHSPREIMTYTDDKPVLIVCSIPSNERVLSLLGPGSVQRVVSHRPCLNTNGLHQLKEVLGFSLQLNQLEINLSKANAGLPSSTRLQEP
jgi:hypothetical protein